MGKYLSQPNAAKRLQEALARAKHIGGSPYYAGPIDGILGPASEAAIVAFRRDNDLSPTVEIDNTMLRLLGIGPALITEPGTLGNIIALPIIELAFAFITKGKLMTWDQINGVVRALLTAIGGYLVGKGLIDQTTATELVGAVLTIGGALWSIVSNRPKVISPIASK
jgi:peptidoglycan hydrolase-like protein with peptidoglycan-binding domain